MSKLERIRLLISSHHFYPSIGGIETVTLTLAEEFVKLGYEVKLLTQTPHLGSDQHFPFEVIRQPTTAQLIHWVRWSQVFLHNNISLRTAWPLLLSPRPWMIIHHIQLSDAKDPWSWQSQLKHHVLRYATRIAVSHALAQTLDPEAQVIGNPYREDLFFEIPTLDRQRELIFLGRLVSQKGADVLLRSLVYLRQQGLTPQLTVIGEGPERAALEKLTLELQLQPQVQFVGEKTGLELTYLLNQHQIMVIPSRPLEAFGLVALEGIACGCVVVASRQGGLVESVGSCGELVASEDPQALAQQLEQWLRQPERLASYRHHANAHLARFTRSQIALAYHQLIESLVGQPELTPTFSSSIPPESEIGR